MYLDDTEAVKAQWGAIIHLECHVSGRWASKMPFGAWTEEDWRLRDRRQPGPYLIHDEASTPSDVLPQAKAEVGFVEPDVEKRRM